MVNPVGGEDRIVFTKTAQQTSGELFELEAFIRAEAPGTHLGRRNSVGIVTARN
jgi:hypothetical protein